MDEEQHTERQPDIGEHWRTYKWFMRGAFIFAGHCLAILAILGWWYES